MEYRHPKLARRRNLGKLSPNAMARTIWRLKGIKSQDVIVGPSAGVDVSILGIGEGRVIVANCDPISLIPSLGPEDSAEMSLYEVASDVATSGQSPRYALFDLNLPPDLSDQVFERYWRSLSRTCVKLGVSILGGHTGRFEGCDYSIIGGATMWTICRKSEYLTSSMAREGDDLILTKTAAYGATAVLSRAFPHTVLKFLGQSLFREAKDYFMKMGTVNDSLTAVKVGIHGHGVTAIHDVTEGGIIAAILEMSTASGLGAKVDLEAIPVSEETLRISRLFRIDPLTSLGEGSLVIASRPEKTRHVVDRLSTDGVKATVIGRLSSKLRGVYAMSGNDRYRVRYPTRDPYWQAYSRGLRKGWN